MFINLFFYLSNVLFFVEFFFRGLKMVTITRLPHIENKGKQLVFEKPNLKVSDKFVVKSTVLRECKHHLWEIVTELCCSALSSFTKSVIYSHTDINTAIMKLKKQNYFGLSETRFPYFVALEFQFTVFPMLNSSIDDFRRNSWISN